MCSNSKVTDYGKNFRHFHTRTAEHMENLLSYRKTPKERRRSWDEGDPEFSEGQGELYS